ncbi:MAG: hypothetical protein FP811_02910 [Desulfobacteraceae bacterium]|nr:hypothetical protein [Desulfobacteraceae bacterium]
MFKIACRDSPYDVIPFKQAMDDANKIFNLRTKKSLLAFIVNDGLEDLTFINKKEWEQNQNPDNSIEVYAYRFRTRAIAGYIAFMFNRQTEKWLIKSFHQSENRNTAMLEAMQKALENKSLEESND